MGSYITLPQFGNRAYWSVDAIVALQNVKHLEASLLDELAIARRDGITVQELWRGFIESRAVNRAQDYVLASKWLRLMDTRRDRSFPKEMDEKVANLTVEDENRVIRRIADPAHLTVAVAADIQKAKEAGKDFSER